MNKLNNINWNFLAKYYMLLYMKKALIIEDERLIGEVLETFLESLNYICKTLNPKNPKEALEEINKGYDVVLCDYMLSNLNAMDILLILPDEKIRKVVIITGGFIDYEKEKFLRENKIKIIYKPFDILELLETIKEIGKKNE